MGPFAEHLLIFSSAFLFPPVAITVLLVVILATFGKSLGLRQIYVDTLISIFEWGARQIKSNEQCKRQDSYNEESEEEDDDNSNTDGEHSDTLRRRHGSGASLCSLASVCSNKRLRRDSGSMGIIRRETQIHLDDDEDDLVDDEVYVNSRGWAVIGDSLDFAKAGIEAIIEDEVTSRFEAEQLATWNMLTRTSIRFYQFVSWKLTLLYAVGFLFRYMIMLPLRFTLFTIGLLFLIVSTAVIGVVPDGSLKRRLNHHSMLISYRILSRCLTAVVQFHDTHNKAKSGGICVANHTSPIDAMILSIDNVYALIGQRHSGLLGLIQRALSRASSHIWFDRSEAKDRSKVTATLQSHCNDPHKLPILIFPEGTCINNTSVMMFKKGSFEVGTTIYPIAMKYDSRFGDPFWNSSEQSWFEYIMRMMTSWAIICNVWYLPPMVKQDDEDAVDFANRVKKAIATKGGLVDLEWDGMLKRTRVPKKLVAKQQEKYAHRLSRYTSTSSPLKMDDGDDEDDYVSFLSPVSGYNSLEDLPEDAIVTDEEDQNSSEAKEAEGFDIKSDISSDLGIDNSPPTGNPLAPIDG